MNRKPGSTRSTKVKPSTPSGMCFAQYGIPSTPSRKLTKVIVTTTNPRNASSDTSRGGCVFWDLIWLRTHTRSRSGNRRSGRNLRCHTFGNANRAAVIISSRRTGHLRRKKYGPFGLSTAHDPGRSPVALCPSPSMHYGTSLAGLPNPVVFAGDIGARSRQIHGAKDPSRPLQPIEKDFA